MVGVLLSALAGALRAAMRQLAAARAEADLEHGRTALLQDLTARLASQADSAAIARAVLDRSAVLVDCDRAWIVVQEAGALHVLGALDSGGTRASVDEDAVAATLAARVIADGEELWSEAGSEEHDRLVRESPAEFGASAAIAVVPLQRASGVPFGALLFGWRTDHVFKPANRDLKRAVARITAQSLERAELYAAQAARISDLAERETVRDAFLAVLSHELRTPVTTIFGVSAILSRTETDAGTAELLRDIQEEAERLRRIVDDLLVLSRSERGAIEISSEPILLQRTVGGTVEEVARRYPSVEVQFHAEPFVPAAMADPTALVQVIYNLVTNAIKYAGQDGPITVTVDFDAEAAAITVADQGPGLGDDPDAVFALFHRADHTKRRAAGTGIGLYVARELVRAMGGEIVGSNSPRGRRHVPVHAAVRGARACDAATRRGRSDRVTRLVRRAGAGRFDGTDVAWSVAEGGKGRRWREMRSRDGAVVSSLLLETFPDRRFAHLELSTAAGLLTLHPEGDGTLHGNAITADGVRHVVGLPWPDGSLLVVHGSPIALAAAAWLAGAGVGEFPGERPVVTVGPDLEVQPASVSVDALPRQAIDADGLPVLEGGRSWPLEIEAN